MPHYRLTYINYRPTGSHVLCGPVLANSPSLPQFFSLFHCSKPIHPHWTDKNPSTGLFSRKTWVSRQQKDKPFWILMKQEMIGWQWHPLDHMQIICTSLQTDNHTSTSPLNIYRPDALPAAQPTASKHWRQSTGCWFVGLLTLASGLKNVKTAQQTVAVFQQTFAVLWHCWLGGRKGIRPVKNWVMGCWHGYLSGVRFRFAYGPADATTIHYILLQ